MKIGIAITTRNRPEILALCVKEWKRLAPSNATIVVVDDASTSPVPNADYRFMHQAGIAAAKNKCIELLLQQGCTHLFLSDDDCWPLHSNWHKPYTSSPFGHLSMTFAKPGNGVHILGSHDNHTVYNKPCGCMLYVTAAAIKKVGGFDVDYPVWGMEHVDFSQRCVNLGISPYLAMDLPNSHTMFHSLDFIGGARTTVERGIKSKLIQNNRLLFEVKKGSKERMPYVMKTGGVLLAYYSNTVPDGQRGNKWGADSSAVEKLVRSCEATGTDFRIFHDCFNVGKDKRFIKVEANKNHSPNVWRWFVYDQWLRYAKFDNIFMVDSTDVEVLRNPFQALHPGRLYVGDESAMKVDNDWMRNTQEPLFSIPDYRKVIASNGHRTLVNCGIVGGSLEIVREYLSYRTLYHSQYTEGVTKSTDMSIFNYIVWKHFADRVSHGLKINTGFKRFEADNGISLFRHK